MESYNGEREKKDRAREGEKKKCVTLHTHTHTHTQPTPFFPFIIFWLSTNLQGSVACEALGVWAKQHAAGIKPCVAHYTVRGGAINR